MKKYNQVDSEFNEDIDIVETTDPAHADLINTSIKQLFTNTMISAKLLKFLQNDISHHCSDEFAHVGVLASADDLARHIDDDTIHISEKNNNKIQQYFDKLIEHLHNDEIHVSEAEKNI